MDRQRTAVASTTEWTNLVKSLVHCPESTVGNVEVLEKSAGREAGGWRMSGWLKGGWWWRVARPE